MKRTGKYGFTLVELLVVIVIIGMLMGMLIPAIAGARARARQAECSNNVKELGSAITQYQTRKQYFPGFCSLIGQVKNNNDTIDIVGSWAVTLLPYIQRNDLMTELRQGNSSDVRIDQYVCPTDNPTEGNQQLSYVGNCGYVPDKSWENFSSGAFAPAGSSTIVQQIQRTGIFADRYADFSSVSGRQRQPKVSIGDIRDGAAQTLLVSERVNDNETPPGGGRRQYPYMASGTSTADLLNAKAFNKANLGFIWTEADDSGQIMRGRLYHISSNHPGGVNTAFCDGHVKSLNQDIDAGVYCQIMTPWGQGAAEMVSGYDEKPLDEGDLN